MFSVGAFEYLVVNENKELQNLNLYRSPFILYSWNSLVFDFHQAADGIQEQQRQEQAGKKYVVLCQISYSF